MADVFLSYYNKDRDRIRRIAELLKAQGLSVWWDTRLEAGQNWDKEIETELEAARCVVVCWSKGSIKSDWVREEANQGKKRKILVPLLLEAVDPPVGYQNIHALNIANWSGDAESPLARAIVNAVNAILSRPIVDEIKSPPPAKFSLRVPVWAWVVIAAIAAVGLYRLLEPTLPPPSAPVIISQKPKLSEIREAFSRIDGCQTKPAIVEAFIDELGPHSKTYNRMAQDLLTRIRSGKCGVQSATNEDAGKPLPPIGKPWALSFTPEGDCNKLKAKRECSGNSACMWRDSYPLGEHPCVTTGKFLDSGPKSPFTIKDVTVEPSVEHR